MLNVITTVRNTEMGLTRPSTWKTRWTVERHVSTFCCCCCCCCCRRWGYIMYVNWATNRPIVHPADDIWGTKIAAGRLKRRENPSSSSSNYEGSSGPINVDSDDGEDSTDDDKCCYCCKLVQIQMRRKMDKVSHEPQTVPRRMFRVKWLKDIHIHIFLGELNT
jgi:hypothetical protein